MKQDTNHFLNSNKNQKVTFEELNIRHLKLLIDLKSDFYVVSFIHYS